MSSFATALAELDSSLQSIHAQLAALGAALDLNDVKLNNSLADARYHAATLRELVRAERPDAEWKDRRSLIQMIGELEAAAEARRIQLRRSKLVELADELDSGSVRHRSATRVASLDAIRAEAIRELRAEAARKDRVKDLPGPGASGWVHWACGLHEETDAAILESLRREFPALERFACDMEENYWVANRRSAKVAAFEVPHAVRPRRRSTDAPRPPAPPVDPEPPIEHIRAEFDRAAKTGDFDRALSLCYTPGSEAASEPSHEAKPSAASSQDDLANLTSSAPHAMACDACGGTFPAGFEHCPFDETQLRPLNQSASPRPAKLSQVPKIVGDSEPIYASPSGYPEQPAIPPGPELVPPAPLPPVVTGALPVDAEVERLKVVLAEYGPKYDEGFQVLDKRVPRKKIALSAVALILLAAILTAGYRYGKSTAASVRTQLAGARNRVEGIAIDSDIQKELEQKLASLKGSDIQASVEHGVVTLVGHTPSKWDAVHAESLALETTGVKLVDNRVEVVEAEAAAVPNPTVSAARRKRQN